jgi:hypothetical protein
LLILLNLKYKRVLQTPYLVSAQIISGFFMSNHQRLRLTIVIRAWR